MTLTDAGKWMRASVALVAAAAVMMTGCTPEQKAAAPKVSDKVYSVTPATLKVKAGLVTGELTDMKVTEQVEEGGRVTVPAKLSGKLVLRNVSTDQTLRMIAGKLSYIDALGKPIVLEESRTAPEIRVGSSGYGSQDRLDPGQETSQPIDVEFPVAALKAKRLKDIRLGLTYIPSAYREESLNFPVSIGGQ
jgi:hypothetical protein